MNIAVIGAGRVGGTLANRWADTGHTVWVGVRDLTSEKTLAFRQSANPAIQVVSVSAAAAQVGVLLLATPWEQAQTAILAAGDLSGKIVIDATNPLLPGGRLALGTTTSAAEEIQKWAGRAKVVKAFNTIGSVTMANPNYGGIPADLYLCGDDASAKEVVAGLGRGLGFEPVDCGPLAMARTLEPMAALWVYLAYSGGYGPNFIFKVIKR